MTDLERASLDIIKSRAYPEYPKNAERLVRIARFLHKNPPGTYPDTTEGKTDLLNILNQKVKDVGSITDTLNSDGKNLLYFSVFLNSNYVKMLKMLLESIHAETPVKHFDVLFITDDTTKARLLALDVLQEYTCHFHLCPTPLSGVTASIKKTKIFEFSLIDEYKKVLYLDCDMLCIKNLNNIFNRIYQTEKLYVSTERFITSGGITTPTHSLLFLTDREAQYIYENPNKILPFNAGQFLFINSSRMRAHFSNLRWLIENWPGEFFFEQSHMNHYFVFNNLIEQLKDAGNLNLISIAAYSMSNVNTNKLVVIGATNSDFSPNLEKKERLILQTSSSTVLVHFAGNLLSAKPKLEHMTEYANKSRT